jgi:hypothetical protein
LVDVSLRRYPRTPHLEGSSAFDDDDLRVAFEGFAGRNVVVTEKIDGVNGAVSFSPQGRLLLQSRSRFLDHDIPQQGVYAGFVEWAVANEDLLWPVLGTRYVMFGEWLAAKHVVFYDALPAAFVELDVLDTETDTFLSTERRRGLLRGLPVAGAPTLASGRFTSMSELLPFLGPSRFKTPGWRDELLYAIAEAEVSDAERFVRETDPSDDMEGLYLKVEEGGIVTARAKYVRPSFRPGFLSSNATWQRTRAVKNRVLEQS